MREPIGLLDRTGVEIREGDVVEFCVTYDDADMPCYDTEHGTVMVDTVVAIGGEWCFVESEAGGVSFAWRHSKHCEVIGNIHDPAQPAQEDN